MAKRKQSSSRRTPSPKPDLTIQACQQQLDAARAAGDLAAELDALAELGRAYASQHDYPRALKTLEQQRALARKIGNRYFADFAEQVVRRYVVY